MKKIYTLIVAALFAATLAGQSPEVLQYQAVVRDASGVIVVTTQVGMKISILQGSAIGTPVCVEEFTPTTNDFGLVNIEIGTVNPAAFGAIDWSAGPYFVKVELDPDGATGGISYDVMGTSQLLSVPYALYAKKAGTATETDPVFGAHAASGITSTLIGNWNTAYGWGNHATAGYLSSYTETDPGVGANTTNYLSKWDGSALVGSKVSEDGYLGFENPADLDTDVETEIALKTGNYWTGLIKTIGEGSAYARLGLFTWASSDKNDLLERLSILDNGNVGIGTASPSKRVHIHNINPDAHLYISNTAPSMELGNNVTYDNSTMYGLFALATTNGEYGLNAGDVLIGAYGTSHGNLYLNSNYYHPGVTNIIMQPTTGNVGIGTTNPTDKLEVRGWGTFNGIAFRNASGVYYPDNWIGPVYLSGTPWLHIGGITDSTDGIRRSVYGADKHYFGGNVGIGTENPLAKLSFGGYFAATNDPTPTEQTGTLRLYDIGDGSLTFGFGVSNSSLNIAANQNGGLIRLWTNGIERAMVNETGLQVNGKIRIGDYGMSTAGINTRSIEIGGQDPSPINGEGTIWLHDWGTIAHQLRYTNGTLYLEAAAYGYGTNPTPNLNVGGNVHATSYTGDGSALTGIAGGTGGVENIGSTTIGADTDNDNAGEIVFQTKNATRMRILNYGAVSIGTGSPLGDEKLYVQGNMNLNGDLISYQTRFIAHPSSERNNTFVGLNAGGNIGIGNTSSDNTAFGRNALTSGGADNLNNTAIGSGALFSQTSGYSNTAIGGGAMYYNHTGIWNVAVGTGAMRNNWWGDKNTAVGYCSLFYLKGEDNGENTAVGMYAGYGQSNLSTFMNSVLVGYQAGKDLTNGSNNLLIGYNAGDDLTTGANNIIIGYDISTPDPATSNHLNIGNLVFGDLSGGMVGIGTTTPGQKLTVAGTIESTSGGFKFPDGTVQLSAATGGTHYLGEEYDDGIIFYIYKGSDGLEHGLIVSKTETTAEWSGSTLVGADRTEDGAYNMNLMPTGAGTARTWVETLGAGWYLPSVDELSLLWHSRYHVNKTARAISSTLLSTTAYYWSSSEYNATFAFYFPFTNGYSSGGTKAGTYSVRAVRAF